MIIAASDIHLKPKIWLREKPSGDAEEGLRQIVKYAREESAEAIILAGDLFDPGAGSVSWGVDTYQRLVAPFDGPILGIQGQHGWSEPSWLSVSGVRDCDIHGKTVEIDGLRVRGVQHQARDQLLHTLEDVPEVDLLVLHQLEESCVPYDNYDFSASDIPEHVGQVIIGDLHKQVTFDLPGGGKWRAGWYPGAMAPQKQNEIDDSYGGFLRIDDGKVTRVQRPPRFFERLQILSEEDLPLLSGYDASKLSVRPEPLPPVVFVKFDPRLPDVHEEIRKLEAQVEEAGGTIIRGTARRTEEPGSEEEQLMASPHLEDHVPEETEDPLQQELLLGLLRQPHSSTIDEFQTEHFPEL